MVLKLRGKQKNMKKCLTMMKMTFPVLTEINVSHYPTLNTTSQIKLIGISVKKKVYALIKNA